MNRKSAIGLAIVLLCSFAAAVDQPERLVQKLEDYLAYYTPEKVYLHTDKPYYAAGDTIWFATYLAHGVSHMATAPSKIVYVELINEQKEVLARRDIGINHGTGAGEFALADTLAGGIYLLRGYTSFMRNFDQGYFFHKELTIAGISPSDSLLKMVDPELPAATSDSTAYRIADLLEVKFFPEGGDLVEGLWSTVGVKMVDPSGAGVQATGEIVNSKNEKVADLQTGQLGMGTFRFVPQPNESYRSLIGLGSQTIEKPFPVAKKEGYVLTVSNLSSEQMAVKVTGNMPMKGGYVLAHVRGHVFLTLKTDDDQLEALVPKKDLPEGIATFTWFDKQGRPQCERLVFVDHDNEPTIRISALKADYKKRQKVSLDISAIATDTTVLSVAITDKNKVYHDEGGENIKSYLLLNSDLRGEIENPGYYFDTDNKTRLQDLDNLLLTQGWRRFTWHDIIDENRPEINHLAEPAGFSIAGRVVDLYNQTKGLETLVTLTATAADGSIFFEEAKSDSAGYFFFSSLSLSDTSNIILQTPNEKKIERKGSKKDFVEKGEINLSTKILLTEFRTPQVDYSFEDIDQVEANHYFREFLAEMKKVKEINKAYSLDEVHVLEEVEVKAKFLRQDGPGRFERAARRRYGNPATVVDIDSLVNISPYPAMSIFDLMVGRYTGFRITGVWPESSVVLLGAQNAPPVFLLNGFAVGADRINQLPPETVDFIDIVRYEQSFGAFTNVGGIVAIYTKKNFVVASKGVTGMTHPGYYHAREFYTPDYSTKKQSHVRTDVRPTLYWKGGLKTAEGTPAKLEFYTSDVASTFEVRIEGIIEDGRPFVKKEEFVVN